MSRTYVINNLNGAKTVEKFDEKKSKKQISQENDKEKRR